MKKSKSLSDFFRISRRIFWGLGVSFSVMVVIVGIAVFIIWVSGAIRNWLEIRLRESMFSRIQETQETHSGSTVPLSVVPQIQPQLQAPEVLKKPRKFFEIPVILRKTPGDALISSSFTDLFSGPGWLDQGRTTMYLDRLTTAFTFPPKYSWQKSNLSTSQVDRFVKLDSQGADTRCLPAQAGLKGKCLSQKGIALIFNGQNLPLPQSLAGKNIVNISIGALDTKWVIGVVTKEGAGYSGWVFYFDGVKYEKIPGIVDNPILTSKYIGILGFGGNDDDWLLIYGSYEGIAYHVRDGQKPQDISRFFGIRVMNNGFAPMIIRSQIANCKLEIKNCAMWYVFSATNGTPKFIKLFQNGTAHIEGAIDLTGNILSVGQDGVSPASFVPLKSAGANPVLVALLKRGGLEEIWEFTDLGFEKEKQYDIASNNINNYPAEVRSVKLTEYDLSLIGGDIVFYVSNDGEAWQKIGLNDEVEFSKSDGRKLLWKATITPTGPNDTSPFLDRIRLDYKVKFL